MNEKGLTEEQKTEYYRRSYTAVDGLWFMKIEERLGFDLALKIDEAVWSILPKIQARTMKGMMNLDDGISDLQRALSARLVMEGYEFEMERKDDALVVIVRKCPWHQIMIKSGRGSLSERVSDVICQVENETWAREFSTGSCEDSKSSGDGKGDDGEGLVFEREARLCRGEEKCRLWFRRKRQTGPLDKL
jgi:hypothetical protein